MDLRGRCVLVTGANSGIGYETARTLAGAGARVLLAGRNTNALQVAISKITQNQPQAQLEALALDLAAFSSVRRCAAELPTDRLDALICNAGLFVPKYVATEDGLESTVGVCHFGHFLLTCLLMERLRAAGTARVVMVASESHRYPSRLDLARFPLRHDNYSALVAYGQAKLCNVLFARELDRRFNHQGIRSNALHPGSMIGTAIFRSSLPAKLLATLVRPFTKTLAQGAATSVYCAVAPELSEVGGRYFVDCREKRTSRGAQDDSVARRLWDLSAERVGASAHA